MAVAYALERARVQWTFKSRPLLVDIKDADGQSVRRIAGDSAGGLGMPLLTETMIAAPNFQDVVSAAGRLRGVAAVTPLLSNDMLDAAVGGRVFVKAECLQRGGSFKFRGAYNRLSQLSAQERLAGVVAYSSGNHAQGVAAAAALVGVEAAIVMPSDAPRSKIEGARRLGAQIVLYDRYSESRERIAAAIADERGAILVPPFEDSRIIAGQGTVGLEIAAQLEAAGVRARSLLSPVSGGGLMAGIGLAMSARSPDTRLYGVEPAGYDDHAHSLAAGHPVDVKPPPQPSICDALMAPRPGDLTFSINQPRLAGAFSVTDDEVLAAMGFAFRHLKLVLEPGGAVALALLLSGRFDMDGPTVIIASGGNVDADLFARAIAADPD